MKIVCSIALRFALVSTLAALPLEGSGMCWVESVKASGQALRISLMSRYGWAVHMIERPGKGVVERRAPGEVADDYFVLELGDVAHVQGGPHDGCTMRAEIRNEVLGIWIEAYAPTPGEYQPMRRTEFLVANQ